MGLDFFRGYHVQLERHIHRRDCALGAELNIWSCQAPIAGFSAVIIAADAGESPPFAESGE